MRRTIAVILAVLTCAATAGGVGGSAHCADGRSGYAGTVRLTVADLQELLGDRAARRCTESSTAHPAVEDHPVHVAYEGPAVRTGEGELPRRRGERVLLHRGQVRRFDDENLFPQLEEHFGDFTIALTLAHEWGHAIQDQAGLTGPTIALEQQADCFAGAWVRHVADGGNSAASACARATSTPALGWLPHLPRPAGERSRPPTARTAARSTASASFQEGYDNGPQRCAAFDQDPPALTDIPFAGADDAQRGGDLPYREVIPATAEDLDAYWSGLLTDYESVQHITPFDPDETLPVCDGQKLTRAQAVNGIAYCGSTGTIAYDHRLLPDVYERSGDFGVAVVIAAEWAVAMQLLEEVTGPPKDLELQQSCFTGSWAGDVVRGGHNPTGELLTLSAGDLDEAIQSFLIFRDIDKISAGTGATAFENVDAFRTGFFQGESACVAIVPES